MGFFRNLKVNQRSPCEALIFEEYVADFFSPIGTQ
jgi:hypothetical protein